MSGLAFISPLCIHASPLYFGGLDYRPHGSLATAATRTSVLLSYTLRPSNRHYFPSKSFSPSSQIQLPRKEEPYLRCSWPMNSPMKPPRRLILSVPRVLDAFCKTWDWPASESSASSGSPISSRYTSFAPRTGRVERRGSENRTPLYWLATTVSPPRINLVTTLVFLGLNELTLSLVPLSVVYWERCFDSLPLTTVVVRLFILSPTIRVWSK